MTIQQFIEENKERMIADIADLVSIPTVFNPDSAKPGQPFGFEVNRGLEFILARAEELGMKVKNLDGYAGEITAGEGDFMIGVLAHEDVVPAGEGWETDPFQAVVKDGKIFGRGSCDDKGPLISGLYAMKYLMDEGLIPEGACLRMIVGTNEEEAWGGINYYTEHTEKLPDYSIVPDGYFPLIYCEKGLYDVDFAVPAEGNDRADIRVARLQGGSGRNVVAGTCSCSLVCENADPAQVCRILEQAEGIRAEAEGERVEVFAQGKSTHAMAPENGINAISRMITALNTLPYTLSVSDFTERYCRYIGMTYNGENFGIGFEDELTGKLTFNIGVIRYDGKQVEMEGNLRYPASMEKEEMWDALQKASKEAGFICREKEYLPPVYIEPDSPFVRKLMEVYRKVTGDTESEAFTIGGATYARAIPGAAAFGPLFPYEEELAHEANEFLLIDSLEKMTEIYAEGLQALLEMK